MHLTTPPKSAHVNFRPQSRILAYLRHTEGGVPIRQIAREKGCHPSTVHRQISRVETQRDDELMDAALDDMARSGLPWSDPKTQAKDGPRMTAPQRKETPAQTPEFQREAMRILRRLAEPGAILAYAKDMEKAVVVRDGPDGRTVRTAVTDRQNAQTMAVHDWLVCKSPGRVSRYAISAAGRAALRRMIEAAGPSAADESFAAQHREWDHRDVQVEGSTRTTRLRFNAAESPISLLARRKGQDGAPFLAPGQVVAAERLREDFELSQMGPRIAQNWERFLTGGDRGAFHDAGGGGSEAARRRLTEALAELGPGLGDIALRVCCFLEGVETAEKRLGWAARSGKIVLRIALQRLEAFYGRHAGADMIG